MLTTEFSILLSFENIDIASTKFYLQIQNNQRTSSKWSTYLHRVEALKVLFKVGLLLYVNKDLDGFKVK